MPLSVFSYNGTKLAQGRDATKQLMLDNPELADEIEAGIMSKLKGAELPEEPLTKEEAEASEY